MLTALVAVSILAQPAGLPAPAPPARPWVRVEVTAQPAELVLGASGTAEVSVKFFDTEAKPVTVTDPQIEAASGTLIDIKPVSDGVFSARYLPPAGKTPQVDYIRAIDPASGALGWTPLKLAATAKIPVTVNKPGAKVTVEFAGRTVGPVTADSRGNASVALTVPPGDWSLRVRAVDESGNETITTQNLPVPSYQRVWVVAGPVGCAPGALPGGWVDVLAVTASGRAAQGAKPTLTSGGLTFSQPTELSPGHLRYAFVAKPGEERKEKLIAQYVGSPARASVTVGDVPDVSELSTQRGEESEKALIETRAYITKTYELLEQARKERDLVLLRCVQEKFARMKALARVSERAHEALRRDLAQCRESAVAQNHEKTTTTRDKVKRLAAEAEACLGDDAIAARTNVQVTGPDGDPDDFPDIDLGHGDHAPPPDASPYQ